MHSSVGKPRAQNQSERMEASCFTQLNLDHLLSCPKRIDLSTCGLSCFGQTAHTRTEPKQHSLVTSGAPPSHLSRAGENDFLASSCWSTFSHGSRQPRWSDLKHGVRMAPSSLRAPNVMCPAAGWDSRILTSRVRELRLKCNFLALVAFL